MQSVASPPTEIDVVELRRAIKAQQILRRLQGGEDGWRSWVQTILPHHFTSFAPHHEEFWEWVFSITRDERPRPFVGVWPRGGGKSTGAEGAVLAVGLRGIRRYALYVRATQEQADKSVGNIGDLFESRQVAERYPFLAERKIGKYGSSKGWRRNRLRTASGFTVDSIGLDTAARGIKVEEQRPDLMVFDDIDEKHDSELVTRKKIEAVTTSLLPAGADNLAVIMIQNLVIPNGMFSQLVDSRADWLVNRILSGPHPSILGLKTETVYDEELQRSRVLIKAGTPTWDAQDLERCQQEIDTIGFDAFVQEHQHQVFERPGALWKRSMFRYQDDHPPFVRVVVGVDPSGGSDEIGIVTVGLDEDGRGYVLDDDTQPGSEGSLNWGRAACLAYQQHEGDRIVAEKNFGGDMVESNIRVAAKELGFWVPVEMVTASRGKHLRAQPVASLYEDRRVLHLKKFPSMESEMTSWVPGDPQSPNRLDALVWALTDLMLQSSEFRVRSLN